MRDGQDEEAFFRQAFSEVMATVVASPSAIDSLYPALYCAFMKGAPRAEAMAVRQHLPDGSWSWPAYAQHVQVRNAVSSVDEDEEEGGFSYTEQAELLSRNIALCAYWLRNRADLIENVDHRPRWRFSTLPRSSLPNACASMDGQVLRHNDPFWQTHPRCGYLECGCNVMALREHEQP